MVLQAFAGFHEVSRNRRAIIRLRPEVGQSPGLRGISVPSKMVSRRALLLSSFATVNSCQRQRGSGWSGYAFIANQEGRAIAAVDLTAFAVARHIRLDDAPDAIIAHVSKPLVYALTPASGTLYEIDARNLAIRRTLSLGGPATAMRLEPGGQCIWILSGPGRRLLRVPLDEFAVKAAFRLPLTPVNFDLSENTGLAAIAWETPGALSFADLKSGHLQPPVRLRGQLGPIRFRKDGQTLLAANQENRLLTVLDSKSGAVVVHLPLAVRPDHFCFHPNGGQLFVTGEGRDAVVVVFPYYVPEVAETILAGSHPGPMAATESHLFVTSPEAGDVGIFNITRRRLIAVAAVGAGPRFVTFTPDGAYALVLNETSGDMAVIRVAGLRTDRRKSAALFTMIPVGSRPVCAVVTGV